MDIIKFLNEECNCRITDDNMHIDVRDFFHLLDYDNPIGALTGLLPGVKIKVDCLAFSNYKVRVLNENNIIDILKRSNKMKAFKACHYFNIKKDLFILTQIEMKEISNYIGNSNTPLNIINILHNTYNIKTDLNFEWACARDMCHLIGIKSPDNLKVKSYMFTKGRNLKSTKQNILLINNSGIRYLLKRARSDKSEELLYDLGIETKPKKDYKKCTGYRDYQLEHDIHISKFSKDKYRKDGLSIRCKNCVNLYYLDNQDQILRKSNEYKKLNPEKLQEWESVRGKQQKIATPKWLTIEHLNDIKHIYKKRNLLNNTTNIIHHVDHVVPLVSKYVCGLHVPWNLEVIEAGENLRKSNNIWPDLPDYNI